MVEAFEHACEALDIPCGGIVPPERAREFVDHITKYLAPTLSEMVRR